MEVARGEIKTLSYGWLVFGLVLVVFPNLLFSTSLDEVRAFGALVCLVWLCYAATITAGNYKIKSKRLALQPLGTKELLQYLKRLETELSPPYLWPTQWDANDYDKLHTLYQVRGELISRSLTESQCRDLLNLRSESGHLEDLKSFQFWLNRQN